MQAHQFKPTSDEIELAECIRRTTARKLAGSFSADAARRVLKESGLSHRDIREICTIADRDGNGKLSNEELCAVIRLAGWVQQCREKVGEHLLAAAGPLPVLKGIRCAPRSPEFEVCTPEHDGFYRSHKPRDITAPKLAGPQQMGAYHFNQLREWHQPRPQPVYPAINIAHMQVCKNLFERAGPINGLMDKETAQEILMTRFNAPFFLLKTIFNLVRTSNRLSLNIFEFTLAAYFVHGLRSRVITALPSEVPRELYDQLWTPVLLNAAPMNPATGADERRLDSMVSAGLSPVTSAQSSTSDIGLTAALRLSPVRKEPQPSLSGDCSSVSSTERKKISKLWKRVAEHCKIEKILKISSAKNRKSKSESVLSSDASIKGTAYSESSSDSSFEALERDSFLEPTMRQRVSMDMPRLPLIYPSESGFYTVPGPVPTEVWHPVNGEMHRPNKITSHSSLDCEELQGGNSGETMSANPAFSQEESEGDKAGMEKTELDTLVSVDSHMVTILEDMNEKYTFLELQVQILQKTVQKLASNDRATKNVHFASDVGTDLGERVRDSIQTALGTSRRRQSLKISKELVGPRDMLPIRSGSSISPSGSTSLLYGHDHRRRHQQRGKSDRVERPRARDRDSDSSLSYSLSSLESLFEFESASIPKAPDYRKLPEVPNGSTETTLPLRSILKIPADRPHDDRRIRTVDHDGYPSNAKNSSTTTPKDFKQATKSSGTTEETLQAWNARFIPVDRIIESREGISVAMPFRKLPRTPRKLPTPGVLPVSSKHSRSRHLPALPAASSSSKFPGALVDDGYYASSQLDVDVESASYLDTDLYHVDTDTVSSSATSMPRSSADLSSIFSHRRHSARTTLLTEIDEYNDTVVRDLKEVAPDLVLHVEKCLLRELRTESDGMYDRMSNGLEALSQPSMAKELEEALTQVRAKAEELKRIEDFHAEVLRQRATEVAKLEQEKHELQWKIADQEEKICSLNLSMMIMAADLSIELPEYSPHSSTSGW